MPDWRTELATWATHLTAGFTHLGRWVAGIGRWLARLGVRLTEIKPSPLQKLAILGGLAAFSIVGAVAFPGTPLGQACVIAIVPGLSLAIGIAGSRWRDDQGVHSHVVNATQHAVYAAMNLKRSVRYVDERLSKAQGHLESGSKESALIEVVRAKTATELSLGAAEQAAGQWESLHGTDPNLADERLISGCVARVEDEHTLIINRGSEHGAKSDMLFAVLADAGDQILDPETGAVIGELPTEKLRVKVIEVQPKYSRAVTFRTYTPAKVDYPALTGFAGLASNPELAAAANAGAYDSIDESISRMLESELAGPVPAREKISNAKAAGHHDSPARPQVRIDIGDRVRQLP